MGILRRFLLTTLILAAIPASTVSAQDNERVVGTSRIERTALAVESVNMDSITADSVKMLATNARLSFLELLSTLSDFEERMTSPDEKAKVEILLERYSKMERDREVYSDNLSRLLTYLEDNLAENQIADLNRFLKNELWYEGFIDESSAETREALDYKTSPTFDSTSLINRFTYEELEEMEEAYLESENKALIYENIPPESTFAEHETVSSVARDPAEVRSEDESRDLPPPWQGMPSSPATTETIRNLLENQSLSALKYYWTELFPIIDSLYSARGGD